MDEQQVVEFWNRSVIDDELATWATEHHMRHCRRHDHNSDQCLDEGFAIYRLLQAQIERQRTQ